MGLRSCRRYIPVIALALGLLSLFRSKVPTKEAGTSLYGCSVGHFFDMDDRMCNPCQSCDAAQVQLSPCGETTDTLCSRCHVGSEYWQAGTASCRPCTVCPHGMHAARKCGGPLDTLCEHEEGTGFHDTGTTKASDGISIHKATGLPPPATAEQQAKASMQAARPWQPSPPPTKSKLTCDPSAYTKECVEDGWGFDCFSENNFNVLVALPYDNRMKPALVQLMFQNLVAMECANPGFNLHLALYDKPFNNSMNAKKTKLSGRTILATIRNIVIAEYLESFHDYVLWLDADVVKYPKNLVQQLFDTDPDGVVAPLVLIESSDAEWYHHQVCNQPKCPHGTVCGRPHCERAKMFYDRAAFITSGANITDHEAFPGNALPWPPYLGRGAWRTHTVVCESVGTVYMLPARVYRTGPDQFEPSLIRKPPPHFPTAFTEHFPIIHFAKYVLGMQVLTNMTIEAEHAYLPKYGLEWHSEPMSIWDEWLQPYRGNALDDPLLVDTKFPSFFVQDQENLVEKGLWYEALAFSTPQYEAQFRAGLNSSK